MTYNAPPMPTSTKESIAVRLVIPRRIIQQINERKGDTLTQAAFIRLVLDDFLSDPDRKVTL